MQVKELSAKLADAESKKAAVEATLALRERQASEVSLPWLHLVFLYFQLNVFLAGEEGRSKEVGG